MDPTRPSTTVIELPNHKERAMRLLLLWILNAVALLAVTWLLPSIQLAGFGTALAAALVLGFINTLVRPVLTILTLPITLLTLGIFYLVLNGLLFWLASALLPGFQVEGFVSAMVGAILYGLIAWVLSALIPNNKD
jgi:putative membrane protein